MGETNKQVRVDNWGVFFLQRLQVFFNKTDYCDLTLQFEGNVQLKVHRLVMSACTEYFSILEHTCEVIDGNTIIMPDDLQADVILPIVNFMYTGMLEFPMSIFDKLYRTAELMNIPILIKLLDAQRKPMKGMRKQQTTWQNVKKPLVSIKEVEMPSTLPGRKLPVWKRKPIGTPPLRTASPQLFSTTTTETVSKRIPPDPLALYDNTPKPTRFEWPEEDLNSTFNLMDSSFNDISYTSKPLLTQDDELRASTSFDDAKYSSNSNSNVKKSKDYSSNIDINDVKDYVKEQKIRSDLGEYEEEDEDDPDNYLVERDNKRKSSKELSPTHTKRVRFTINEKENKEMTISVTPKNPSDMDHTKIISEVLKRYPHLVKKNKNIKLKIMAKSPVSEPVKLPPILKPPPASTKLKVLTSKESPKAIKAVTTKIVKTQPDEGPWVCKKCSYNTREPVEFVLYYLYRKHMTDVHHEKFDSKMCKHCGHQSSKHNLLMYHQYTKHGVKPPAAYNFPKCSRCPFIALTENLLQKHLHSVHSKFDLQCAECKVAFNSQSSLLAHVQITGHSNSGRSSFDCQYCTKRFNSASDLFSHIRSSHRDEARRDGMVSIDETGDLDDEPEEEDIDEFIPQEEPVPQVKKSKKIEVVSNVNITDIAKHSLTARPQAEPNVMSTEMIADMSGSNQGIVDIVVLDENQQYILHNDEQLVHSQQSLVHSQPEYILPEITGQDEYTETQSIGEVITTSQANVITQSMLHNSEIASTDELVMVLTDHDYNDANNGILTNENSNIVVLYSHPVDGQQNEFITSEGKLILNPQTGLLELRNESTDSQDTQIESIELIQREINNGLMQQNVTEVQGNQQVPMTTNEDYKDLSNQENVTVAEMVETDSKSDILDQVVAQQYEQNENIEDVKQKEEPMEIDETCNDIHMNDLNEIADGAQVDMDQEVSTEEIIHQQQAEENQVIQQYVSDVLVVENASISNQEKNAEDLLEAEIGTNERLCSETDENIVEEISEEVAGVPIETNDNIIQEHEESPMITQECSTAIHCDVLSEIHDVNPETIHTCEVNPEVASDVNQEVTTVTQEIASETNEVQEIPPENDGLNTEMNSETLQEVISENHCIDSEIQQQTNPEIITDLHHEVSSENHALDSALISHGNNELNPMVSSEIHCEASPSMAPEIASDTQHEINSEMLQEVRSEVPQSSAGDEMQIEETEIDEISAQNEVNPNLISQPDVPCEGINTLSDTANIPESPQEENSFPIGNAPISNVIQEEQCLQDQPDFSAPTTATIENPEEINFNAETSENINNSGDRGDITKSIEDQDNILAIEGNQSQDNLINQNAAPQVSTILREESNDLEKEVPEEMNFESATNQSLEEDAAQNEDMNVLMPESMEQDKRETAQEDQNDSVVASSLIDYEINGSIAESSQSQDSLTSQSSKELAFVPNVSTKISILNDWDDTEDSQQSENLEKDIENTVNKLIDDWDDDDDEGQAIDT